LKGVYQVLTTGENVEGINLISKNLEEENGKECCGRIEGSGSGVRRRKSSEGGAEMA
jgi:hypothetical protein